MIYIEGKRLISFLLSCGLWTFQHFTEASDLSTDYFIMDGMRRPGPFKGTTTTTASKIVCTATCDLKEECVSVNYETLTGSCEQSGDSVTQLPSQAPGWMVIKKMASTPLKLTGAFAWQTTTGWGGFASKAIDGRTDTNYYSGTCIHTEPYVYSSWAVELVDVTFINGVLIYFQTGCGDCVQRASKLRFLVSMSRQDSDAGNGTEVAYYKGPADVEDLEDNPHRIDFLPFTFGKDVSSETRSVLVAAIDFGTTFSGYAFSSYAEFDSDPTKVHKEYWYSSGAITTKGPTCILIEKDGKTERSFGYDAETDYADDDDRDQLYLFKRFKMMLNVEKGLNKNAEEVNDVQGKPLKAMTVFSLSIRCLKKKLETLVTKRLGDATLLSSVRWVLTVPAIWSDAAKQFMRQAAIEAGILDSKLTIALVPECASLCCRYLKHTKFVDDSYVNLATLEKGTQYMVLDAGGGTVDITIHEVLDSNTVKEVEAASGGAWGGVTVDQAFYDFFEKNTTPGILEELGRISYEDKLEFERRFEIKKRTISPDQKTPIKMHLPICRLNDASKSLCGKEIQIQGEKVKIEKGVIFIDSEVCKGFFKSAIEKVIKHVTELLNKPSVVKCKHLVMVGGFSDSPMLQEAVKKAFPEHKVIIPTEADMCVLKGAVMFGHDPAIISERISRYTYGTDITPEFDPSKHPEDKRARYTNVPGDRCKDVFYPFVEVGDRLKVGQQSTSKGLIPLTESSKEMHIRLFASKIKKPQYVTDKGCHQVGQVIVPLPTDMKSVDVSLVLGGTEIAVECKYRHTGHVTRGYINFLG